METKFYNGVTYQIEYQPQLSNSDYTKHKVYHIKTKEESYPKAKKAIATIMAKLLGYEPKDIWSKGDKAIKNILNPSIFVDLHIYYEFTYDEDLDVFVYTFVEPYDD